MLKKAIIVGIGALLAVNLYADFPDDFQRAKKLFDTKKNQDAQEAFEKLALTAPTPESKAECLAYSAKALGRDKAKYEAAMEAARKIGVREISVTTQMSIMQENDRNKELFEAFKDEDFSTWREVYQLQGYSIRGEVERVLGQYDAAKKDLIKAVAASGSDFYAKIHALTYLKQAYEQTKDNDNVIKTSKKIFEIKSLNGNWTYLTAVLSCAGAQLKQGKPDEALETMKLIDHVNEGYYKCLALTVYGDIYAAQGKKDDAVAKYKEATAMKGQPGVLDASIVKAQEKLEALGK